LCNTLLKLGDLVARLVYEARESLPVQQQICLYGKSRLFRGGKLVSQ